MHQPARFPPDELGFIPLLCPENRKIVLPARLNYAISDDSKKVLDRNLYVADTGNFTVRKVALATTSVTTIAGTVSATWSLLKWSERRAESECEKRSDTFDVAAITTDPFHTERSRYRRQIIRGTVVEW